MANKTLTLRVATIGLATALSLATVTTGIAEPRWGAGAAIGAGLAGVAVGAAIAASPNYGYGYYDYAPGAAAPMADSYDAAGQAYPWPYPTDCRFSIYNC
jgi:hypothetical protein